MRADPYIAVPKDIRIRIEKSLDAALALTTGPVSVLFRADDIGVPSARFTRLAALFMAHRMPLNAAVVPAWLSHTRWRSLYRTIRKAPELFCWHQHGWRHANHETVGKKQEFGDARSVDAIRRDLIRGRRRLEMIMGSAFVPVFTPPWNRCGAKTLDQLQALAYAAVSRSRSPHPAAPAGFREITVHVDLHTMRAATPAAAWARLLGDVRNGLAEGVCGIMIHHQLMSRAAFDVFQLLLEAVGRRRRLQPMTFREWIESGAVESP